MTAPRDRGFTLLEVVLSVAILAALGVLVLSSLTLGAKGFMSTRADVETSERARLALTRMAIDLRNLLAITTAQNSQLVFTDKDGNAITLAMAGSTITLNNNLLIENLATYPNNTFLFTYQRSDGTTWVLANGLDQLYKIVITLRLTRPRDPVAGTVTQTFTEAILPRNNGGLVVP